MTTPGSGRSDLTPTQAKKLYDVVKNGITFPRDKLSKRRPIMDRLMPIIMRTDVRKTEGPRTD